MTKKDISELHALDFIYHDKYGLCRVFNKLAVLKNEYNVNPTTYKGCCLLAQDKGVQWNGGFVSIPLESLQLSEMRLATTEEISNQNGFYYIEPLFDLRAVFDFCQKNKVDVLFQDDLQHYCFINYKEGDRAYAIELTAIEAMIKGIINYEKEQAKTNVAPNT